MAAQGSLGTGLPGTLIPAPSVLRLSSHPDLGASAPAPGKRRLRGQTGAKRRAGGASSAPCVPRLFRTPGKWAQEGLRAEAALWGPLRVQAGRGAMPWPRRGPRADVRDPPEPGVRPQECCHFCTFYCSQSRRRACCWADCRFHSSHAILIQLDLLL